MTFAAIALLLVAIAAVTWNRFRRKPSAFRVFAKRVVNDPAYSDQLSARLKRRSQLLDEASEASPPADFEIPGLIRELLSPDKDLADAADTRLRAADKRAVPLLLQTLDDPRCTWDQDVPGDYGSSPALRVCRLLSIAPCRVLGDKIGHLVDCTDRQTKGLAIEARAALGRSIEVPFVLECLNSKELSRHERAQEGIEKAINERWAEPEFVSAVVEWSRKSIFDPTTRHSGWGVRFFAAHGGPDAIETLQSSEILNLNNYRTVHFALAELASRGRSLPKPLLQSLLGKSLSEKSWPWPWAFEPSLKLLAAVDSATAAGVAAENLCHENETIARAAIDCVRESNGLPEYWKANHPEAMTLSHEERAIVNHLDACSAALGQIGNGGLSQYFFNSSGDDWPRACEALRAVGYPEGAEILERAANMIAPKHQSVDRSTRVQRIANFTSKQSDELDSLSGHFWGLDMDRIMLQFMLNHKPLFNRIYAAQKQPIVT